MIEVITIKNVLSFKDKVTFSFEAIDNSNIESPHFAVMPNGTKLLKFGVVYGPNASGKSNLLYAIDLLSSFWVADPQNIDIPTRIEPFLLDIETPNTPSEYSIKFWIDGIRYSYILHVTGKCILYEKLSYYKTSQPIKIFERELKDGMSVLTFNPTVQRIDTEEQKALSLACLPNKSFFAARGHVNMRMEHVDKVREWIHKNFMPIIVPNTHIVEYGQNKMAENQEFKNYLLDFLHMADFNITGINEHIEEELIPTNIQKMLLNSDSLPEEAKRELVANKGILKKPVVGFEHTVKNSRGDEKYELGFNQQSLGTKRLAGIEAAIFEAVNNNRFLLIDEMETSLHPDLMEYIIQEFVLRSNESQLLIATHYPGLLNTIDSLIRKDNVWFVEKNEAGASELYSLVEFNGLNKISHFEKAYRTGRFGALPSIKG